MKLSNTQILTGPDINQLSDAALLNRVSSVDVFAEIEPNQNAQTVGREGQISTADSRLQAWVIPTDEELLIALDTVRCILGEPHPT